MSGIPAPRNPGRFPQPSVPSFTSKHFWAPRWPQHKDTGLAQAMRFAHEIPQSP